MTATPDAWELIHERKLPAKKAAEILGLTRHQLYERLESLKLQRERTSCEIHARAPAAEIMSGLDGEARAEARAVALFAQGYQAKEVAKKVRRPVSWVLALRMSMTIG